MGMKIYKGIGWRKHRRKKHGKIKRKKYRVEKKDILELFGDIGSKSGRRRIKLKGPN